MEYGLIGRPLGHSFSPGYFRDKFLREGISATYTAFELACIEDLRSLLEAHPGLQGFNVTIPYKEAVLPFLDEMHPDAAAIGAVNCVRIQDGKLTGYNTDWAGFADSLMPLLQPHHGRALVLGSGGASKAVRFALQRLGIEAQSVSRTAGPEYIVYEDIDARLLGEYGILVNTTPLGTAPDTNDAPPLPYEALMPGQLLYDLIYNPPLTRFLAEGQARGATVKNGLEMLHLQAEASWRIWQE